MSNDRQPPLARLQSVQRALQSELKGLGFDEIDLIPLPRATDRVSRLRTIEEVLSQFDQSLLDEGSHSFIVSVKNRATRPESPVQTSNDSNPIDGIYDAHGKLNVSYLEENARLLIQAGETTLARKIYRTLLQSRESEWTAHFGLARCAEREGNRKEAIRSVEESIAFHPTKQAYAMLIRLLFESGEDRKAVECIERALYVRDMTPEERADLHVSAGNAWFRLEELDSAEAHYHKALQIRPSLDEVRSNLGTVCLKRGQIDAAYRCFQDASAANPSNAKAQMGMGQCWEARGNILQAHDCYAKAAMLAPQDSMAIFYLVKAAYDGKTYETAERILSGYVESNPVNLSLLYSLAGLKFHLGKKEEARKALKGILELKPDHKGAQEFLKRIV